MPLRDIAIVTIVLILAILALRRPWVGIMNWTWLSIQNPHRYSWGFAYSAPLAAIAAISTLLALLMTKDRQSPFKGPPVAWLLVFSIWFTASWLFGYDVAGDYYQWTKVAKIYFMSFVALALLHTRSHIMIFTWVTVMSLAFLSIKGGFFTIVTGGAHRVWGPTGSFIADNNHLALATIITIPMMHFLQLRLRAGWPRHLMSVAMLLSVASALGSQSRGALLALIATGAMFWLRSSRKGSTAILLLICLVVLVPMMPDTWWDRMNTIQDYQQDESAMGRINGWLVAIEVAKHNLFGGGMSYQHQYYFSIYGVYNRDVIAAHSIYFQILGNHGFIGLFFYLGIWVSTFGVANRLRKLAKVDESLHWAGDLGAMVQVSLVAYAVGGAFLSMPYFDLPYNLMIMVVLAYKWASKPVEERRHEEVIDVWPFRKKSQARKPAQTKGHL